MKVNATAMEKEVIMAKQREDGAQQPEDELEQRYPSDEEMQRAEARYTDELVPVQTLLHQVSHDA